ncbi:MAG TPA: protein kinase [Gemmatimonadales bacterium]|nr:protein kinase [Gemmatimonadales bacterium]
MVELQDRLRTALSDRYRLEREIGRGGMATVFLGHDLKHHRPVALKVLHPELAYALGADRFLREVETAAGLTHPHVLPLFDSGQTEGLLWYTMPFIDGETLRGRLAREGRLPVADALRLGAEVADALAYAHQRGVIHRDVKPENILLSGTHALVADFGIAKAVDVSSGATLTQAGTAVGTPAYMSPEQASGAAVDGRSDVYSLGCVVYEMLTGAPPFTGPTAQAVILKRFTDPVPSARQLRPELSEAVEQTLRRALAKDPADRYANAGELAAALTLAGTTPAGPLPAARPGRTSIAVLPFVDMSPQRDQEYFTDGIAEEIINALTKVEGLRVASRSSAFAFKGKELDVRRVGEQLGVGTLLEGSVRKAGNRLRITAQLVDVADGYHLWSERYDRELEDVFAVQDEIAESIVRALRLVFAGGQERRAPEGSRTGNVQAYEYYLRGRQFFHQFREKGLQFARRMFTRAIEIDPQYARAYAGVADCSSMLYHYWDASEANLQEADSASRKALELAPGLAEAHAARGLAVSLSKHYDEADREFEEALRLDPRLFEGPYYYALACFQRGDYAKAARLFRQASEVRPEDYQAPALGALCIDALQGPEGARAAYAAALPVIERHLELNPEDPRALYLGANTLSKLGERARSLEWAGRAQAIDSEDSAVLYNVACVYAVEGQLDDALKCLEQAVHNGFGHREWIENDPDLAPLHALPGYRMLLESVV